MALPLGRLSPLAKSIIVPRSFQCNRKTRYAAYIKSLDSGVNLVLHGSTWIVCAVAASATT
jgi:hypothetical protein